MYSLSEISEISELESAFRFGSKIPAFGVITIVTLLLAIVFTILAFVFIVPEKRRPRLNAFGRFLHDTCNFKYLIIEKILQALYIFLTIFCILAGFFGLFNNIIIGLVTMIVSPIVIRLVYEFLMMAILVVKNVIMINNKLKNQNDEKTVKSNARAASKTNNMSEAIMTPTQPTCATDDTDASGAEASAPQDESKPN